VISWFQILLFKFNLYRYIESTTAATAAAAAAAAAAATVAAAAAEGDGEFTVPVPPMPFDKLVAVFPLVRQQGPLLDSFRAQIARRAGLHSLPGVRLFTWTTLAVINRCFDCKIM
jgi:hypothetical protein